MVEKPKYLCKTFGLNIILNITMIKQYQNSGNFQCHKDQKFIILYNSGKYIKFSS